MKNLEKALWYRKFNFVFCTVFSVLYIAAYIFASFQTVVGSAEHIILGGMTFAIAYCWARSYYLFKAMSPKAEYQAQTAYIS